MKKLLFLVICILTGCGTSNTNVPQGPAGFLLEQKVKSAMEYAYFEGQKDAISGDVRIDSIEEANGSYYYVWRKSPWDQGDPPIYVPGSKP